MDIFETPEGMSNLTLECETTDSLIATLENCNENLPLVDLKEPIARLRALTLKIKATPNEKTAYREPLKNGLYKTPDGQLPIAPLDGTHRTICYRFA